MIRTSRSLQEGPAASRRLLGGIGLLVFLGAFFVMPLCAALSICSMPCCEHGDQNGDPSLASADMMACETECAIRSDDAATVAPAAIALDKSDRQVLTVAVMAAIPAQPAVAASSPSRHSEAFLHHSDAPLHVLNSVFRI